MQLLNLKKDIVRNMYDCLSNHPEIKNKFASDERVNLLIGFDDFHKDIASNISQSPAEYHLFQNRLISLNQSDAALVASEIEKCDVFIFLYRLSTEPSISKDGPSFLQSIKKTMQNNWKKSILFKDYGNHFYEAFAEPRANISLRNAGLIDIAMKSKTISFVQGDEYYISAEISNNQKWTSIDGGGNRDIIPGEIATHFHNINGRLKFSGTFLSTIPFAIKYGVVSNFLTLNIEKSRVTNFVCENQLFSRDFDNYLSSNPSNSKVEEFGIGTNCGVSTLYGINAGFEERHPGLHLGLGGGLLGSHHMDLIFKGGEIFFDEKGISHLIHPHLMNRSTPKAKSAYSELTVG
ncbi:MAG: hypothetical protein K2P98_01375 [Neisseriaceae bacterium]|nr:hypothetical protein [Neisseriaceae bacterium]